MSDLTITTRRAALAVCWPVVAAALLEVVPVLHRAGHHELAIAMTQEDGPLESFGAWACGTGALVCGLRWWIGWRGRGQPDRSPAPALAWAGLGFFLLLMTLEELSWGQRLLGIRTPATWAAWNIQGEMNLHNLRWVHPRLDDNRLKLVWLLGVGVYLGLLPPVAAAIRRRRGAAGGASWPVGTLAMALAAWLAFWRYGAAVDAARAAADSFAAHDAGEAVETVAELLLAAVALVPARSGRPRAIAKGITKLLAPSRRGAGLVAFSSGLLALLMLPGCLAVCRDPASYFDQVAWYRLGQIHQRDGDMQKARAALEQSLRLQPDFAPALALWQELPAVDLRGTGGTPPVEP